jgi:VanZ family protein
MPSERQAHRSSAWPLSWVAVALIVYATLYPLTGWRWPESQVFTWLLPKVQQETSQDLVSNLLGYLPLGAILCLAHLRSGRRVAWAALATCLTGALLSYTLELIQFTVPGRVPSISDWALNTLGTAWGILVAVTVHALGLVDVWHRLRERWFIPQAGHGLALLWVWPIGLLFPPPLPLGEGQLMPHVRIALVELSAGTPFQPWLLPEDPLILWASVHASVVSSQWGPVIEALTVAAGLLVPMCVACALARQRALRLLLLSGAVLVAISVTTLSTALNFGPVHGFTWASLPALLGLLVGSMAGGALINRRCATSAWVGVLAVLGLVVLIHLAPSDPYYAETLQAWENGRFIRFHGLSRWIGILWPYAAGVWLLTRGLGRDGTREESPRHEERR